MDEPPAALLEQFDVFDLEALELNLGETEAGRDLMAAAAADLRDRGIHIDQATDVQLADEGLVDRLVARLEFDGFGQITNRQRSQRLDKLDAAIKRAEMELREARKAAAIEQLEAQFAAESAA
jgi:hypothetical protein